MEVIKFKECNAEYARNQQQYLPLPCHKTEDGTVTSCWSLSFLERLKVLVTGHIYLQLLTFNKPVQPQKIGVNKPL